MTSEQKVLGMYSFGLQDSGCDGLLKALVGENYAACAHAYVHMYVRT